MLATMLLVTRTLIVVIRAWWVISDSRAARGVHTSRPYGTLLGDPCRHIDCCSIVSATSWYSGFRTFSVWSSVAVAHSIHASCGACSSCLQTHCAARCLHCCALWRGGSFYA